MDRAEFKRKIDEMRGEPGLSNNVIAAIIFTDGERHLTPIWSVQVEGESVRYVDVHCRPDSTPIEMPFNFIKDVLSYNKTG